MCQLKEINSFLRQENGCVWISHERGSSLGCFLRRAPWLSERKNSGLPTGRRRHEARNPTKTKTLMASWPQGILCPAARAHSADALAKEKNANWKPQRGKWPRQIDQCQSILCVSIYTIQPRNSPFNRISHWNHNRGATKWFVAVR